MAVIKSNICKMCGGLLDIDVDRQVYICPFCGVTFDYEYFRKDNVLELAKKSITRHEFGAARDAYEYMLKKDPHNFEALRGLILCKCKWTTMAPIQQNEEVHLHPDDPELIRALENCMPEHKEYFGTIKKTLEVLKDYRKSRAELANLENDRMAVQKKLRDLIRAQTVNNSQFSTAMSDAASFMVDNYKVATAIIEIGIVILVGLGYATIAHRQYWIPILLAGFILFFVSIYNIIKFVTNKSLEAAKVPVKAKLDELEKQVEAKNAECVELLRTYKTLSATVVTTYRMEEPPENKEPTGKPARPSRTSSDFPSSSKVI